MTHCRGEEISRDESTLGFATRREEVNREAVKDGIQTVLAAGKECEVPCGTSPKVDPAA